MSLENAIVRAFDKKKRREKKDEHGNWKYPMYWAIDLHDVIIPGTYTLNNDGKELYPHALEVLQWLSNRNDMSIILFTSSYEASLGDIVLWLGKQGVHFNYINENPECDNNSLCDFSKKWYFDIMLEDKAGFDGQTDWAIIKEKLIQIGYWKNDF